MIRRQLLTAGAAGLLAGSGAPAQGQLNQRPLPRVCATISHTQKVHANDLTYVFHLTYFGESSGGGTESVDELLAMQQVFTHVLGTLELAVTLRKYLFDRRADPTVFKFPMPDLTLQDIAVFIGVTQLL